MSKSSPFQLVKNTALYSVGLAVSRLGQLLLLPIYTRFLNPEEFGVLALLTVYFAIATILFGFGMSSALFKSYFEAQTTEEKKECVTTALFSVGICILIIFVGTISFPAHISFLFLNSSRYSTLIVLVSLAAAFEALILIPQSILRAQKRSIEFGIVNMLKVLFLVLLSLLFCVVLKMRIEGIIYSWVGAPILVGLMLTSFLLKNMSFSFSGRIVKRLFSFGVPLLPSNLALWLLNYSDQYFLGKYANIEAVGLYSLGVRIASIVNTLVVMPFTLEWGPFMLDIERNGQAKRIYSHVMTYFTLFSITAALVISIFSKEIVRALSTPAYYSSSQIVPLIVLSFVMYGVFMIFSLGTMLTRRTYWSAIATCVGAVISITGCIVLISRFESFGAATSRLVGYTAMVALAYCFSKRLYPVRYESSRIVKIFICGFATFFISLAIHSDQVLFSLICKAIVFMTFPFLLIVLRFFTAQEYAFVKELCKRTKKSLSITIAAARGIGVNSEGKNGDDNSNM